MNHLHDESTGGPAFPAMEVRTADTQDLVANASQGMTLRDWFAGQAMQGIFATDPSGSTYENIAKAAYKAADAMLADRNKPAVSEGHKLVPLEPTKKMIDAARDLDVGMADERGDKQSLRDDEALEIYKVMIGAADGI